MKGKNVAETANCKIANGRENGDKKNVCVFACACACALCGITETLYTSLIFILQSVWYNMIRCPFSSVFALLMTVSSIVPKLLGWTVVKTVHLVSAIGMGPVRREAGRRSPPVPRRL